LEIVVMNASTRIERSDRWTPSGRRCAPRTAPRRVTVGASTIHPMGCACSDCALSNRRDRARIRAWAILFIGLAGAFYGTVIANAPEIAAAFGWSL
jgi:hypothetical protein